MPNADQTQNTQARQFTPEELEQFKAIGITNPDPTKQYTVDELETAKNNEEKRIRGVFQHDETRRDNEVTKTRNACSSLVNKYIHTKQAQASRDSGKENMQQESADYQNYKRERDEHYNTGKGRYIGAANVAHGSYVLYMLFDLILSSGEQLFPPYNGPRFDPQPSIDKMPVTSEEKRQAQIKLKESLDRMGINPVYGDPNDPKKITDLAGPDFSACTPAQQQARRDEFLKVQQELGLTGPPQQAPPTPTI